MVDNVRLPEHIERGATGGPRFSTMVVEGASGVEQRVVQWTRRRGEYTIGYGVGEYWQTVLDFFHAQLGRGYGFLFREWGDYTATDEALGTGDGVEDEFQIVKTYSTGVRSYVRTIKHPVAATLVVKVNGTPTVAYTLLAGGIIDFTVAPPNGQAVTASYEFDVPVRFDDDFFSREQEDPDAASIKSLKLIEILE